MSMHRSHPAPVRKKSTSLTFTDDELTELAYHLAAGDVLLNTKTRLLPRVLESMARSDLKPPSSV